MPRVSIIVPVYNVRDKLTKCLESLIAQSCKDIEIILVNDGSNDGSEKICDEYSSKYFNIKTIHSLNSGVSKARNKGIANANSPYIMFVDADDYVEKNIVEMLLIPAETKKMDFVMCGYNKCFIKNKQLSHTQTVKCKPYVGKIDTFLSEIKYYIEIPLLQGPCWKLFRKDIVTSYNIRFPEEMSYGEDATFVYRYLLHASSVGTIDKPLYNYNNYGDSTLSSVFRKDKYEIKLFLEDELKRLLSYHKVNVPPHFFQRQVCNQYISYVGEMWRSKVKVEKEKRLQYIYSANEKKQTEEAFREQKNSSLQIKLLSFLISNKLTRLIDFYFGFKEKFRKYYISPIKKLQKNH